MDLILWRHAEAVEAAPGMDDLSRVLTSRGERQAAKVAAWLNQHLPPDTRVLVSPAVRTRQTAQELRHKVEIVDALAPRKGAQALISASGWPNASRPVMVVGHQPTLGLVLAQLVGGHSGVQAQPWRIRKAGLWWLRCERPENDRPGVSVMMVQTPDFPD